MTYTLKPEQKEAVVAALVEGNSIRSTERMTGIHRDTIMRLGVRLGETCADMMDEVMRDLPCKDIQVDEIWCYVGKKQRHVKQEDDPSRVGDFWTWCAIDRDTKLVPTFTVGKRDRAHAQAFIWNLAPRLTNRVQLSSDALNLYVEAIENAFGGDIDYGTIVKSYEAEPIGPGRYSPPKVTSVKRTPIVGEPNEWRISTSHVERLNLTTRMCMRRFTRLTNAFCKKPENLRAAVALHFAHYNFVRRHQTLRVTPAMAAGVTDRLWSIADLVSLAD